MIDSAVSYPSPVDTSPWGMCRVHEVESGARTSTGDSFADVTRMGVVGPLVEERMPRRYPTDSVANRSCNHLIVCAIT